MPYEVAGNAAAGDFDDRYGGNSSGIIKPAPVNSYVNYSNIQGGGQRGVGVRPHKVGFGCLFIAGVVLCIVGAVYLKDSEKDTRGAELTTWSAQMGKWQSSGEASFESLQWSVSVNSNASNKSKANSTGTPMQMSTATITPQSFGEKTWSDAKSTTPSSLKSVTYRATVQCPGTTPNRPCNISIRSKSGFWIKKYLARGPATQTSKGMSTTAQGCAWRDSGNPMATVGMGSCNRAGPNFGPSCADGRYMTPISPRSNMGCPNDVISTTYWTSPWYKQIANQPRFTYEASSGKCWDYTDCFCTGCGMTFKSDTTKGWGFTGYGYYVRGRKPAWVPFAVPFARMTGNQKAQQCANVFNAAFPGKTCPRANINLVCFNAGGYPKPTCKSSCLAKGRGVYTPAGRTLDMWKFYSSSGPWSVAEGSCSWTETNTQKLTAMSIATDASGANPGPGKWVSGTNYVANTVVAGTTPLSLGASVPVSVTITSRDGPVMEGAVLTDGCNMKGSPSRCFGLSAHEMKTRAEVFLGAGAALLALSLAGCYCMRNI